MDDTAGGFQQFDEAYDFQPCTDASVYYAICSTPRSGGHFLGHLMYSTGAMGYPLEYFLAEHFSRWAALSGRPSAREVIDYIKSRRTSANGCFGFKVHFPEFSRVFREFGFDSLFPGCRFLLMEREDLLAQAISLVRATQTGQWISMHKPGGRTRYNFDDILRAMKYVLEQKVSWRRFFALTGRQYLNVSYESLVKGPSGVIEDIARYLEIAETRIRWALVLPKKQADEESAQWYERFRKDVYALSPEYICGQLILGVAERPGAK